MKTIKLKCENCGGELEVNSEQDKIFCQYCGAKILIDDNASELRRVEDVKLQARKQNHEQTIKEKKELDEIEEVNKFKKGKLSKFVIVFTIICLLFVFTAFKDGKILSGIIGIIQIACFSVGWLSGMQIIKEKFKGMHTVLIIIGFALIIPFIAVPNDFENYDYSTKCEKIDLEDIYLKEQLIKMDDKIIGEIDYNENDSLHITLCNIDKNKYKDYKEKFINFGYKVDSEEESDSYDAYNEAGYKISLDWDEDEKELEIDLDAPIKMADFEWPATGLAAKLPKPESKYGKIDTDSSTSFSAYIGNTTLEDFEKYIKSCQDLGFTKDYSKEDKWYHALNNEKIELTIEYKGYKTMYISVGIDDDYEDNDDDKPTTSNSNKTEEKPSTNNNSSTNNGLRKDFKNAMDSYEKFMDEYIEFMNKYNSNPSDYELLKKYSKYMSKYSDMVDKFEKWDDEDLNDAETKYYIEVQNRVNKKLTDAALEY